MRIRENATLSVIRRLVPGAYGALREVHHPALEAAEISFEFASVIERPLSKPLLHLFAGETLSEARDPMSGFIRNRGNWNLVFDCGGSKTAASLWLLTVMDYPDRFLKTLGGLPTGSGIFFRPLKDGWLVGFQAQLLKAIIKHGNRGDC